MDQSPASSRCEHIPLARSPIGDVSVCPDCGVVHLSLDCVSIRLEVTAFTALVLMVSEAQSRLGSTQLHDKPSHSAQAAAVH